MRFTILAEQQKSVVAVFVRHTGAEDGIKALRESGFNTRQISIVGREFFTDDQVLGCYSAGDRIRYWGKMGAFWDGLWGLLAGAAFLIVPGVGPVVAAGHITSWIMGAIEAAVVIGGLTAIGSGLVSFGIPRESVSNYETAVKLGKYLLIAQGTPEELGTAREILQGCAPEEINIHVLPSPTTPVTAYAA
jgi:hypothetical protein